MQAQSEDSAQHVTLWWKLHYLKYSFYHGISGRYVSAGASNGGRPPVPGPVKLSFSRKSIPALNANNASNNAGTLHQGADWSRWPAGREGGCAEGPARIGLFPDTVSDRAQRHVKDLMGIVAAGGQAAVSLS